MKNIAFSEEPIELLKEYAQKEYEAETLFVPEKRMQAMFRKDYFIGEGFMFKLSLDFEEAYQLVVDCFQAKGFKLREDYVEGTDCGMIALSVIKENCAKGIIVSFGENIEFIIAKYQLPH